ncbi:hypothetical protein JDV02_004076 [Purpureocillium takamizusanense]|uniref:CFEM domain-containing protein n=1 Tax=Purpureocillium takamizusanense TaxID=2060973 RepID=A0A9Q8QEJ4_9HYPO|nr:uncharacterized protein JDV02_004076 [Purpureocillium takamizusanense]UNI17756.1 hypothetical protein JDV02_004076 [Purpureocillium takamizusanense]
MKFTAAAIVAFAALASAQTLADIPSCAIPCLDSSIKKNTECSTTDVSCICKSFDKIQGDATTCVIDKCGTDAALNKVLPAATALCKNGGGGGSSAPASSSAAASTSSAPASSAPASSSAPATQSGSASATGSAPATTLKPTGPSQTGNGTQPTSSSPVTAGAAGFAPVGGLAMLALGALAL